jgi:hypothetical protein
VGPPSVFYSLIPLPIIEHSLYTYLGQAEEGLRMYQLLTMAVPFSMGTDQFRTSAVNRESGCVYEDS